MPEEPEPEPSASGPGETRLQMIVPSLVLHWPDGRTESHSLDEPSYIVGRSPELDPRATEDTRIECESAALSDKDLKLDYEHSKEHLWEARLALLIQAAAWGVLTVVVQAYKKPQ